MFQDANAHVTLVAFCALAVCCLGWFRCERRMRILEQKLQSSSEALGQMMEIQINEHRRVNGIFGEIEERILNLSAPETEPARPLDRRHQVLTMSRNGFGLDEITKRLNIPRGEAELILSLSDYVKGQVSQSARSNGEGRQHAQA